MNQRHGKGTLNFPNGEAKFEGFFNEGNMTKGKIEYLQTGAECWFDGTFKNNQWDKGRYKKGPAIYQGVFLNQAMNGKFKIEWQSGIKYFGMVEGNKLHGEGEMTLPEGEIAQLKGVWKDDQLERCTLLKKRDGTTATNYVPNAGKLIGPGTVTVGNCTYKGTWDDSGELNGNGSV